MKAKEPVREAVKSDTNVKTQMHQGKRRQDSCQALPSLSMQLSIHMGFLVAGNVESGKRQCHHIKSGMSSFMKQFGNGVREEMQSA